jgi:leucyl-tRNA synthetase
MNQNDIKLKWQARWDSSNVYSSAIDMSKTKYYVLDMFPYPSGNGLHVGHSVGYIGSDIIARKKRMEGFNVLHPMGWDSFGLPAEQFAIKTGIAPSDSTSANCKNFKRQLKNMGLSYDWDREISTSDPYYYKWTQFLFLKLYEKGLVYESDQHVWWCNELKTVLANEEVINGRSERGDYPCIRKPLKQWKLKITAYADRLLDDLDDLDWPESIKKMQRDWIGRSEGVDITFKIDHIENLFIDVFSTRPETIFGVNSLVISTEHPLIEKLFIPINQTRLEDQLGKLNSLAEGELNGFFTGSYAIHPFTNVKLPIYVSNYVLSSYGHGAVMSVPAHDERDNNFSCLMGLTYTPVLNNENKLLENSDFITGLSITEARQKITAHIIEHKIGKKIVRYKLHDWLFSRQRYWGEPFPLYKNDKGEVIPAKYDELPILLPKINDYAPTSDGKSPLQREHAWLTQHDNKGTPLYRVTDTMPGWAGSCWYYLRFMDPKNNTAPFSEDAMKYWNQVDLYIGGAAHATMHLLYARFWHKVLYDHGLVSYKEPFNTLYNQGLVTADAFKDESGRIVPVDEAELFNGKYISKITKKPLERFNTKMSKSLLNVVTPESVIDQYGVDTFRLYMMFIGPLDKEKKWNYESINGCSRLLNRIWNLFITEDGKLQEYVKTRSELEDQVLLKLWSTAFFRIDSSFKKLNFNTAIAAFMEFMNHVDNMPSDFDQAIAKQFLLALAPFAPHVSSELWERMGFTDELHLHPWPRVKREQKSKVKLMINGKFQGFTKKYTGEKEADKAAALQQLSIKLRPEDVKKIIYIPEKVINILTK